MFHYKFFFYFGPLSFLSSPLILYWLGIGIGNFYFMLLVYGPGTSQRRGLSYRSIDARFIKIKFNFIGLKEWELRGLNLKLKQMFSPFCLLI